MRAAVFAFVVAGAALHAATHTRAFKRSPRLRVGTAIAFRLALAATAQTAVAGRVRIPVPMPSSMAGFLARRTLPPLFFVSAATLRTESTFIYTAAVLAELTIYVAMQPAACAGMLADAPGGIYFFAAIARRVHEAALRIVIGGAGAGAALTCPAHACRVTLFFFFASAGVLGAAASRCGGTRCRAAPAAVATGVYAAAVAAVILSRLTSCPPLPPHQARLLAAGPPPGGEVAVWGRVAEKAKLVASDVAAVAAWAARSG